MRCEMSREPHVWCFDGDSHWNRTQKRRSRPSSEERRKLLTSHSEATHAALHLLHQQRPLQHGIGSDDGLRGGAEVHHAGWRRSWSRNRHRPCGLVVVCDVVCRWRLWWRRRWRRRRRILLLKELLELTEVLMKLMLLLLLVLMRVEHPDHSPNRVNR